MNNTRNDLVDVEIKEYLSKEGFGTMKTENSLSSQLMSSTHWFRSFVLFLLLNMEIVIKINMGWNGSFAC